MATLQDLLPPDNLPDAGPLLRPEVCVLEGWYSSDGLGEVALLTGASPQCAGSWQHGPHRGLGGHRSSCFAERMGLVSSGPPKKHILGLGQVILSPYSPSFRKGNTILKPLAMIEKGSVFVEGAVCP